LISPNPSEESVKITYILPESTYVSLGILDMNGNVVSFMVDNIQHQGKQEVIADLDKILPGVYLCLLRTTEAIQVAKLIKIR